MNDLGLTQSGTVVLRNVEDRLNEPFCDFACVEATVEACTALDPDADVPDVEKGFCRPCAVDGCRVCSNIGSDTCETCQADYRLANDGKCYNRFWAVWYVVFGILGFLALWVLVWLIDLATRPVVNGACLQHALHFRSRSKLRQPKYVHPDSEGAPGNAPEDPSSRQLWPLRTNLCTTVIAGPGLALSFRFQVAVIVWAVLLGTGWLVLGLAIDERLFTMGTRRYDSPRQQCLVVFWGWKTQKELMWAKVVYLAGAYLLTFVGALMFSVSQHRTYEVMDEQHSTHKDFTLKVDGLVGLSGSERVEEELKELLVQKSGHNIEAVSIGWDMRGREETIMAIIEEDLMTLHGVNKNDDFHSVVSYDSDCSDGNLSARSTASRTPFSLFRSAMSKVEATFLCTPMQKVLTRGRSHGIPERHDMINRGKKVKHTTAPAVLERSRSATPAPPGEGEVVDVYELVCNLQTSGSAWVVFETEDIRNEVGCRFEGETLTFRGLTLSVSTAHSEPDSIKWENLLPPDDPACSTMSRVRVGLSWVIGGMFLWLTVFYMPFVWVSMRQTHSHGVESSGLELFVFGMVVCIGNVIMYTVCSEAADRMKFTFQRSHEVAYMVFYTAACMFNVFLDMVVTMVVAYHHLKGLNVRTHDGLTLDKVPTVTRILMTYGMQRELADNLLAYSFPGTFLIPFLIEPFAAVYVPYKLMTWLVGSHESIRFSAGETYLATAPFDLSRYADIHLNVILATLVLFFPGGNNLVMFFGLAVSHIWIYLYDHLRVLRFSPSFRYASKHVDWVAQWMSCIPTGLILSALAIKYNQMVGYRLTERLFGEHFGNPNSSNIGLVALGFGAFWLHVLLHSILFIKVVPLCGVKGLEVPKVEYRRVAQRLPFSWLTANPVGVLRSTYFYNHKVPLTFCVKGKEHLLKKNIELGQYFEDRKIEAEDYSTSMQSWRVPEECRAGPSDQL